MVRYDKKEDEHKTKAQIFDDQEEDTEKTQELDREEDMKKGKKEHWELEEGEDIGRRDTKPGVI